MLESGLRGLESAALPACQPATSVPVQTPPAIKVAIQFDRLRQPSPWEAWRFCLTDVLLDEGQFGGLARTLRDDGQTATVLHPGLAVALHRDEAEGYYLNLSSGAPVWFVMWRVKEDDPSVCGPEFVTLSYHEAGRLLDAQERVDSLPLPANVRDWLQAFADEHYRPEPKQRRRPASFRAPDQR